MTRPCINKDEPADEKVEKTERIDGQPNSTPRDCRSDKSSRGEDGVNETNNDETNTEEDDPQGIWSHQFYYTIDHQPHHQRKNAVAQDTN